MSWRGVLFGLVVLISLSQVAIAAGQVSEAMIYVNEVDELLKQALKFREQSPWHMSAEQRQECDDRAHPYRVKTEQLKGIVKNSAIPAQMRKPLSKAIDNTYDCFVCKSDDSSCYAADDQIKKAKAAQ